MLSVSDECSSCTECRQMQCPTSPTQVGNPEGAHPQGRTGVFKSVGASASGEVASCRDLDLDTVGDDVEGDEGDEALAEELCNHLPHPPKPCNDDVIPQLRSLTVARLQGLCRVTHQVLSTLMLRFR